LTGILLGPRLLLDPNLLPPFIIAFVLGAAVVGYMRSLPLAYAGGLIIGIAQSYVIQYTRTQGILAQLSNALPFIMIAIAVVLAPRAVRASGFGASFIVRTREIADRVSNSTRLRTGVGALAFFIVLPFFAPHSLAQSLYNGMGYAVVFLSLVILTGYSGQISLGHTAFMGFAAFAAAHLATDAGWPAWAALLLGTLAAAPVGALIGFVAVRVHGLHLALMTLAFAFMADQLFFSQPSFSGGEGGIALPRPEGFTSERGFYYFVLLALVVCIVLAVNLRTGRTGRILAGMRDSETASRSLGIAVTRYKVLIFALSATMAGLGGILIGMQLQNVGVRSFIPFYSLIYMTLAVIGGIFAVGGAVVGGLLFGLYPLIANMRGLGFLNTIQYILFGLGATLALAQNPEGMYGELRRLGAFFARLGARRAAIRPEPAPISGGER
jgi:branched-chain amino acid transport system permease protein